VQRPACRVASFFNEGSTMNTRLRTSVLGSVAAALFAPCLVSAQTAFAERSEPVVLGQEVNLFNLPTKDATGDITKYWDVTITLQQDANGKVIDATATSVPAPKIRSSLFVVGNYVADNGEECTLQASALNGRTQYDLRCFYFNGSTRYNFATTWFSGPIKGHPYETDLVAAGLDTIVGNKDYSWGRIGFDDNTTFFSCFNDAELHSARQVGGVITLINYGSDNVVDCQMGFTRVTP
jgi:hypothetical protein